MRTRRVAFAVLGTASFLFAAATPAFACAQVGPASVGSDCTPPPSATPPPQPSNPSADGAADRFMALTNGERSSRGIGTLAVNAQLQAISMAHAIDMAQSGQLYHNPDLSSSDLRAALGNPYVIGENVGRGSDVDSIHEAFMQSSSHRDNILRSAFTSAGMAVVSANGSLWVVETFMSPPRGPMRPYFGAGRGSVRPALASRATRPGGVSGAWQWMTLNGDDDVPLGAGTAVLAETSTASSRVSDDAATGIAAGALVAVLTLVRRRRRRTRLAG